VSKKDIVEVLLMNLEKKLEEMKAQFESVREAIIDAPGPMQSKSDTTKFQMSRWAENILSSINQVQRCILSLKKIDLSRKYNEVETGTLVKVTESQVKAEDQMNERRVCYFLLPSDCISQRINFDNQEIIAISVNSPVGKALLNKKVGDEVLVKVPYGERLFKIKEIE
jgi:transcription elongation GreA/GreB family factor